MRSASPSIEDLLDRLRTQGEAQSQRQSDDALWKAWARTESLKRCDHLRIAFPGTGLPFTDLFYVALRLIATMIATDAWWSYSLGEAPLIRTRTIQFEHPCSAELFQSSSARSWKRLVEDGSSIVSGSILIQMHEPSVRLSESQNVSPTGIIGLLSIIWIRILEVHHHAAKVDHRISNAPQIVFALEESGNVLSRMLDDIYRAYARFLGLKNPNCITMWHFLNLNLFSNLQVFELAAGRNGADSAHEALKNIAAWSHTWYARRACLHAAGIYTAMNRRRINDGTMFHSEVSIFAAALVLGLYVFMMGSSHDDDLSHQLGAGTDVEPYEFLNEVDWPGLGGDGSASSSFSPSIAADDGQENAARRWVREGGVVSFSGVICEGGYNAAKMILLEFASLLEEVGKWDAKPLCRILRIMSDSLLDIEDQPDCI